DPRARVGISRVTATPRTSLDPPRAPQAPQIRSPGAGSAPPDPHPIAHLDLAAGRYVHVEGEGVGVLFFVRMGRLEHRPVAAHRLENLDGGGLVLVIAELDLPGALAAAVAQSAPTHLLALTHHVEGFAHLDAHL